MSAPDHVESFPTAVEVAEALYGHLDDPWPDDLDPADFDLHVGVWRDLREAGGRDLLSINTAKPVEWVPGAERIIRARERQSWIAQQGEGKTQAAIHLAAQVCESGGRVMYLDVENDAVEMASRLQAVLASYGQEARDAVAERFSYLPDLNLSFLHRSEDHLRVWAQALLASDLLIIDSMARVLSMCGKDENSNMDIADWMREYIDPIVKDGGGVAVLMLDNMGHEATHARGAINKAALVEAVYKVKGGKKITPAEHGTLQLVRDRSRSGLVAKYIKAGAGGGTFERLCPQEGDAPSANSAGKLDRQAALRRLFIERPSEEFSLKMLVDLAGGVSRNTIKDDMADLVAEGAVVKTRLDDRADWWKAR